MKIRLVLLLVVFLGLAVTWASKTAKPPTPQGDSAADATDDDTPRQYTKVDQLLLSDRPLPGKEMHDEADVSVRISVDPTPNKHRLLLEFTEAHGYYVETFYVRPWYKATPDAEYDENAPGPDGLVINKYIPPNGTMTYCSPLVPSEMGRIGGDMGTSENWGVEIRKFGRARTKEEAPNPLPVLAIASEECN